MVLTHGISPDFRGAVHLFMPPSAIKSVPVYQVTHLHADGVHCRESAGTGQVVFKVVSVTRAAVSGSSWTNCYALLFYHIRYWYEVRMCDTESIVS